MPLLRCRDGWSSSAAGLAALLLAASAAAERLPLEQPLHEQGYELIARRQGVAVYRHRHARVIRVAAEGRFALAPDVALAGLLDYEHQAGQLGAVREVRVLSRTSAEVIVYQRLRLPWLSDRDYALRVRWGASGPLRWLEFAAQPDPRVPPRAGVVRLALHEGSWQLRPAPDGRGTLARLQVLLDLGGWLPRWMARSGTARELPALFRQTERFLLARRAARTTRAPPEEVLDGDDES